MDACEYVFVFQNLNILCVFSDRFFDLVFFWFWFLGSTGSMTGPIMVTLLVATIFRVLTRGDGEGNSLLYLEQTLVKLTPSPWRVTHG
jgi:hypothetical protein